MSQFYGEIQGSRGMASRGGTKNSGIWGHIRGWNVGVKVDCRHVDGRDVCYVYKTQGSGGSGREELIATITEEDIWDSSTAWAVHPKRRRAK